MNLTPAAVDDVSATSLVSTTTQLVEFGRCHHFALLRAAAVRVSDDHNTNRLLIDCCLTPGVVTSPSHPDNYPHNIDKKEHIIVDTGKILRLEFTIFAVSVGPGGSITTCPTDFVRITDGDGTTLMDNSCGFSNRDPSDFRYFQPPIITTKTNKVEIYFHTNDIGAQPGWSLFWKAVAGGECYHGVCVSKLT